MQAITKIALLLSASAVLSGCMENPPNLKGLTSSAAGIFKNENAAHGNAQQAKDSSTPTLKAANAGDGSEIISALISRQSVLPQGSHYAKATTAILKASSGVAEAELRASKLRAVARSKNWLPTIGPSITLSSLGELAGGLVLEQVLLDTGKRKAERAFAAADVEVSAVALTQDVNDRVSQGLTLYISAAEAREKSSMSTRGLGRMREFNRVVSERVKGGLSSLSDQRVVRSTIAELEHEVSTHLEAERSANAELATLVDHANLPKLDQAYAVSARSDQVALEVLNASATARRTIAEAKVQQAGLLPSLALSGILGQKNSTGLTLEGEQMGLGTKAGIEASKAREVAAEAKVGEARQNVARVNARMQSNLDALIRQERDAAELVQQTRANYRLFQDQFEAGQKTVMDVMAVYSQMISDELRHIDLKFDIVLTQIEMARVKGLLVNGADI